MTNLTLAIDDEVLRRARIRALEQGTSVNAVVRDYIEGFAGESESDRGLREFVESACRSTGGSGPSGRAWTREELYEERLGRYGR